MGKHILNSEYSNTKAPRDAGSIEPCGESCTN